MNINNFETLKYEENAGVGFLTLNRSAKLNALNNQVLTDLKGFFKILHHEYDYEIKGLVFTGAGEKAFIAGADIAEMSVMSVEEADKFSKLGQEVTLLMEGLKVPIIAAVNGFALGGGCEMAMACDFILATDNAVFGQPEVKLGLIPGFGGTQRLSNYIGRNKARELVYTGRNMKVAEAIESGLVLKSFPDKAALIADATQLIGQMAKNSPKAISIAKKVMNLANDLNIGEGLSHEKSHFSEMFNSEDMQEGTKAFIEKRKPIFIGK